MAAAGVLFVIARLASYRRQVDVSAVPLVVWAAAAVTVVACCSGGLLLAEGWRRVLRSLGVRLAAMPAIRIYGLSQLAKYVPGNIFHLAGRQALGTAAGLPQWPLVKSAAWELASVAGVAGLFGVLGLPAVLPSIPAPGAIAGTAVLLTIVCAAAKQWGGQEFFAAAVCYCGYIAACAGGFVVLAAAASPGIEGNTLIVVAGVYALAFVAGMITPGAPAGVGVRELVLYGLLHPRFPEQHLLLLLVLSRAATVTADLLFYSIAVMLPARTAMAKAA